MTSDQTQAGLSRNIGRRRDIHVNTHDRNVLRFLAGRVAELSTRPVEEEKKRLWYKHNALQATRPPIFCDPENGWTEIITSDQMQCTGELAREWEMSLRKEIFWAESMGDDRVVERHFNVPYTYTETDWGMHETRIGGSGGGAYRWDAPLTDYADLDKLRYPEISVDHNATEKMVSLAEEILGDILEVRLRGVWWWTLGMTWTLVNLRGLTQVMLDMYDYPDDLHQLMAFLRDGHLAKLDFLEENGLLSLNNDGTYVGSGGFGWTDELPQSDFQGKVRTIDMWGFAESQETSQVSPEMFGTFILPYQLPILERFGINCYGCCEALDERWEYVKQIPRLRRVSVSPWADLEDMADKLGSGYILSLKPNPAYLAVPSIDEDSIRRQLRKAMEITKGCRVEIIMKDNHTIGNNPDNVTRWCRIAREEAGRVLL